MAAQIASSPVSGTVELVATHGGLQPQAIVPLKRLGQGRAAEANLVEASLPDGSRLLCVEKVFRPGLLTRAIYRASFQAPFGYQSNRHAILASYYRRRVAGAIFEAMGTGARVAEPLYVRWDAESKAYVLASEYVRGRGIIPAPTDAHGMRRWWAGWVGRQDECPARPHEEMQDLLRLMRSLESLLRSCGLEGSGWQVCTRAMVSTANLLRDSAGYTVVDLESGIPAVLVPTYLLGGLRIGAVPLFDDVDADRLREWLDAHEGRMLRELGRKRYERLRGDAERLIEHTEAWKASEPAIARHTWRAGSRACREAFKQRCVEQWRRCNIIDERTEAAIRPGRRIFTRLIFLLGLIPGAPGRLLQRVWANRPYRALVGRFFRDRAFRDEQWARFVARHSDRWRAAGRIDPARRFDSSWRFLANALLSKTTPAAVHRWCSDPAHRGNVLRRMWLTCVSPRFQSEYGRHVIRSCIRQWEESSRLTPREAMHLRRQLESSDMDEYVRCFGMHMGLKLLLPLLAPLKFGGGAAFLASGNVWFLFLLFLMPACRTAITLWRMLLRHRPAVDYVDALLVGMLPTIGSLAYPVQMYSRYRELSLFLLRDSAARLGRWLPIYGGKDSRVEIGAVKCVNFAAECLEIGLAVTAVLRRRMAKDLPAEHARPATIEFRTSRWHRLADEQLRLIAASEAEQQSLRELLAHRTESKAGSNAA